jgi:hypothetical protein
MLRQLQLPLLLADPALPKSFEFVETQYRTDTGTHTSTLVRYPARLTLTPPHVHPRLFGLEKLFLTEPVSCSVLF